MSAWRRDLWSAANVIVRRFSITLRVSPLSGQGEPWWITTVYGPTEQADKGDFLQELRDTRDMGYVW